MDTKPENTLADLTRQTIRVGNPPAFLFNDAGMRQDRELINLSIQLRIAEALEKQANELAKQTALMLQGKGLNHE